MFMKSFYKFVLSSMVSITSALAVFTYLLDGFKIIQVCDAEMMSLCDHCLVCQTGRGGRRSCDDVEISL